MSRSIGIASDHGGKVLKAKIVSFLRDKGWQVRDFGVPPDSDLSVDYPDYAANLSREVASGALERGILVCGSGIGMCIAANKIAGIRAAMAWDEYSAKMSRLHNDSNILCLGERALNHDRALDYVTIWLDTEFEGARHQKRLDKIKALER
jgi:ribose 5-phosphate isomerase B